MGAYFLGLVSYLVCGGAKMHFYFVILYHTKIILFLPRRFFLFKYNFTIFFICFKSHST